jgi:hypothetical protein
MSTPDNIHRYLDEAFADIPRTPETADLKEEIRGNLQARVHELESGGSQSGPAAAQAIAELGDIRQLVESVSEDAAPTTPTSTAVRLIALNRVKPSPLYVVRATLLSLVLAGGVALITVGSIVGATGTAPGWSVAALPGVAVLAGIVVALLVGDGLARETSQHYPMRPRRAFGFGLAAFAGLTGLGFAAAWFGRDPLWSLVAGCVLALASLIAFIALGVTQTNRLKPWVKEMNQAYEIQDRFSQDPASAARFGIYTVVIWIAGFGIFALLSILVGFAWSWLALLAALLVFFLVLARMLFAVDPGTKK